MRDAIAELTERAQVISQETGSKVGTAIRDVISAAAGLAGFTIESARDVLQYMVRRAQMSQEEADRLIRQAEGAHAKRPASERNRPTATKLAAERAAKLKVEAAARAAAAAASSYYVAPSAKPVALPPSPSKNGAAPASAKGKTVVAAKPPAKPQKTSPKPTKGKAAPPKPAKAKPAAKRTPAKPAKAGAKTGKKGKR
jgi:polyhydroxyalkanoate synthesis regulator phasin